VQTTPDEHFVEKAQVRDYFYLCHGNEQPSIILLGQFTGPANLLSGRRGGWANRPFGWIKTSINPKPFGGGPKRRAPNHNSTIVADMVKRRSLPRGRVVA